MLGSGNRVYLMIADLFEQIRRVVLALTKAILVWVREEFIWGLLIMPILLIAMVYGLSEANVLGWSDQAVCKAAMEIIHPILLVLALSISIFGYFKTRDTALLFLAVLNAFTLSRELIGQGFGVVFYPALIGLLVYGNNHRERIAALLRPRWTTSFLGMCFVCYFLSQTLDRGLIKRIIWLFYWDTSRTLPYSSNFEETLETLGGLFLMCTSLFVLAKAANRSIEKGSRRWTQFFG